MTANCKFRHVRILAKTVKKIDAFTLTFIVTIKALDKLYKVWHIDFELKINIEATAAARIFVYPSRFWAQSLKK